MATKTTEKKIESKISVSRVAKKSIKKVAPKPKPAEKKPGYRSVKKATLEAQRKAPKTAAEKKKQASARTKEVVQQTLEPYLDFLCLIILVVCVVFFISLRNPDTNQISEWCSTVAHFLVGRTALVLVGFVTALTIWILLRYIKSIPPISRKIVIFLSLLYFHILVIIAHFDRDQNIFSTPQQAAGVPAFHIDTMLREALGSGGTVIVLFFISCIFILYIGNRLTVIFSNSKIHSKHPKVRNNIKLSSISEKVSEFSIRDFIKPELKPADTVPFQTENMESKPTEKLEWTAPEHLDFSGKKPAPEVSDEITAPEKQTVEQPHAEKDSRKIRVLPLLKKTREGSARKNRSADFSQLTKQQKEQDLSLVNENGINTSLWLLPDIARILDPAPKAKRGVSPDDPYIQEQAAKIEQVLEILGAPAKVVDIQCGPTFSQYGVEPGFVGSDHNRTRVRIGKIESRKKDLEMALSVEHLSIEAPIPGKTYIGVQVQNKSRITVTLREVIENKEFKNQSKELVIALGKDINGEIFYADLTRMPHLMIAGSTGSGKSVCLNAILACLLLHNTPEQLKLVLIDPKRVELTGYNGIPHLITPVVTGVDQVNGVLQWVLREMDMRNLHFMDCGVRNIQEYNQKHPEKTLPYIVVVIDELANLMMTAKADVESSIVRLAQTARAMGIHLIVATQRPSADVITGTIKANLPTSIAFAVASPVDSMVILDRTGAEDLFGKGDMYYLSGEESAMRRLQCVYVSDGEIKKLVDYWKKTPLSAQGEEVQEGVYTPVTSVRSKLPDSNGMLTQMPLFDEAAPPLKKEEDPQLEKAIALVRRNGRASANLLVSSLSIGYSRANRLLAKMEDMGIISGPSDNPAIPRTVLDYGETETDTEQDGEEEADQLSEE